MPRRRTGVAAIHEDRSMKTAVTIGLLAALLLVCLLAGVYLWWSLGDVQISLHGLIAMVLGCVLSLAWLRPPVTQRCGCGGIGRRASFRC